MGRRFGRVRSAALCASVVAATCIAVVSAGPGLPAGADTAAAPSITVDPDIAVVAAADNTASFTAAANGSPTPTVQWQEATERTGPWTDIAGATDPTLTITPSSAN